jgi:putative aldouronate transport system permease protein
VLVNIGKKTLAPRDGTLLLNRRPSWKAYFAKYWILYALLAPVLVYFVIFHYVPMYGVIIAWKRYNPAMGIIGSPWVGWRHFESFFGSVYFWRILRNTLLINFYSVVFGFPIPIIFALMLNELRNVTFKRTVQTISYLPHFISTVVVVGMVYDFLNPNHGIITSLLEGLFGLRPRVWLNQPDAFRAIYVTSEIWQRMGWSAIIYIAALSSIDPELYEAATIDGAGTLRKMWSITLVGILPTIVIMFILRIGQLLNIGVEKIILLYNPLTYETGDVISSFVYRRGFQERPNQSFATAVDLFNQGVNLVFLVGANIMSRRLTETSLW